MSESVANVAELSNHAERTQLVHHVVETVADAEGVDPLDLEPLSRVVDTEALDALFGPQLTIGSVPQPVSEISFEYHGYEVCVSAVGTVSLTEL